MTTCYYYWTKLFKQSLRSLQEPAHISWFPPAYSITKSHIGRIDCATRACPQLLCICKSLCNPPPLQLLSSCCYNLCLIWCYSHNLCSLLESRCCSACLWAPEQNRATKYKWLQLSWVSSVFVKAPDTSVTVRISFSFMPASKISALCGQTCYSNPLIFEFKYFQSHCHKHIKSHSYLYKHLGKINSKELINLSVVL